MDHFMLLMRGTDWDKGLAPTEMQEGLEKLMSWIEGLRTEGTLHSGQPLYPQGRVVHAVSDGPFVESKEAVGGYLLIEAENIDIATEIAKQCPALKHGLYIEVRPIAGYCPMHDRLPGKISEAA